MMRAQSNRIALLGFTLVELMVAITLGLILLAAISTVFVGSKQTYKAQDSLARLQENARFAMQFIVSDMRLAGYYGCLDNIADKVTSVVNSSALPYDLTQPAIEGLNKASGQWEPSAHPASLPSGTIGGSDAIAIRFADPTTSISLAADMPNSAAPLTVTDPSTFEQGDIIMIADCTSAHLMQITNVVTGSTLEHAAGGADASKTPPWPGNKNPADFGEKKYTVAKGPQILRFATRRYFIATNADGIPSLFRDLNGGSADEMVQGIDFLKITYGVDTDNPLDYIPNIYVDAANVASANPTWGWKAVVTVRIGLIARSLQPEKDAIAGPIDIDGDTIDEMSAQNDGIRRRAFQSTVRIRNHVPIS